MTDTLRALILSLVLAASLASACHRRMPLEHGAAEGAGPGYVWSELSPGVWAVAATTDAALAAALRSLCPASPCTLDYRGSLDVYRVERLR